ncbi:MAG: NAD(P)-dependent oxidoreductase [Chloroflexi bacterium]|nr:MAG: NAD(P)-dependent oxidoreductase [Chloroflexota bacterium]
MNILITGVAGNLGSHVAAALAERGHTVRGADFVRATVPGVECVAADMVDYETCIALGAGADVIAHLGAYHGVHLPKPDNPIAKSEKEFFDANIASTFNLFRAAVENNVPRVVWASSTVVFERYWQAYGIYSLSKIVGEEMCRFFHRQHNRKIIALRYGGFVPRDFIGRGFGMLETWIELEEVVKTTVAAIENTSVDLAFYDVQTPLPFTEEDERAYRTGDKLAVLTKYWPQHADLLRRYAEHLPPQVYLSDVERTQRELGFTIERDFGWFLDELSRGRVE